MILKIHQLICAKVKCWACKSSHSIRRVEHTKKSPQTNFTIVNALKRFNFWNHVSKSLWLNLISIQAHNDILCAVFSICDLIYGTVNGYLDVCKCFGYNKSELYISDVVNNSGYFSERNWNKLLPIFSMFLYVWRILCPYVCVCDEVEVGKLFMFCSFCHFSGEKPLKWMGKTIEKLSN